MEDVIDKMDAGSKFADCEALLGVTEETKKILEKNGVVTIEDFQLLSKADLTITFWTG